MTVRREHLAEILDNLPPPNPGFQRVFRGQTRDFGSIRPSAYRPDAKPNAGALACLACIADALKINGGLHNRKAGHLQSLGLNDILLLQALAQHYGIGSVFVDVTTSLDVALWFATHNFRFVPNALMIRAGNVSILTKDLMLEAKQETVDGFLYVLDIEHPERQQDHPYIVDISEILQLHKPIPRLENQSALLVYPPCGSTNHDLWHCLACNPIEVASNLGQDPSLPTTSSLFPDPFIDPWYTKLLEFPIVPSFAVPNHEIEWVRPLPIPVYVASPRTVQEVIDITDVQEPPLISDCLHAADSSLTSIWDRLSSECTRIFLNYPYFLTTAALQGPGSWNHRLLWQNTQAALVDEATLVSGERVPLRDVFIEVSPLEHTHWDRVATGDGDVSNIRAVHLEIDEDRQQVTFFDQAGSGEILINRNHFTFDEDLSMFTFGDKEQPVGLSQLPCRGKWLLLALFILGELRSTQGFQPFPSMESIDRDNVFVYVVPFGVPKTTLIPGLSPSGATIHGLFYEDGKRLRPKRLEHVLFIRTKKPFQALANEDFALQNAATYLASSVEQ